MKFFQNPRLIILSFSLLLIGNLSAQSSSSTNIYADTSTSHIQIDSAYMTQTDSLLVFASKQIGIGYQYGGSSPESGFDCSGFVSYVFRNFGYNLPRSSRDYKNVGTHVELKDCRPGDIVVFAGYDPKTRPIGHVGIITENLDGEIYFIHSATSKKRGVVVSNYNGINYYTTRFVDIRRVLPQ